MKKKILFWTAIIAIIVVTTSKIYSWYCLKDNFNPNFKIGVLETTVYQNLSLLTLYDENLNVVGRQKFDYGNVLAFDADRRKNHKGNVFIMPNGSECIKDKQKILEYDPKTGEHIAYDMKTISPNSYAANDDYIFEVRNYITRYNRKTKEVDKLDSEKFSSFHMDIYDNMLYVFSTCRNYEKQITETYLYIIDPVKFKIVDKINLCDYGCNCGTSPFSSIKVGDNIYFTSHLMSNTTKHGNSFSSFNVKTKEIKTYQLQEELPFQIVNHGNKLYIAHCELTGDYPKALTEFDLNTHEQKLIELQNAPRQIEIYNNKLYSRDWNYMYVYDLDTFKLIKKVQIRKKYHKGSRAYFYLAGFFIND